jgi:hypothetical protein
MAVKADGEDRSACGAYPSPPGDRRVRPRKCPMLDGLLSPRSSRVSGAGTALCLAVERAAGALGRLDQALAGHPLMNAFLYRTRLDAVRRQAAVDGKGIDPWHLAAVLEGLRLRMDHALRIVDRGEIFEAARSALALHQWITAPDFDQEAEVQAAERHLDGAASLPEIARRFWAWLEGGGSRPPIRAAVIRNWMKSGLLHAPVPLTGPRALSSEAPGTEPEWICAFLDAVGAEALDHLELLRDLERHWLAARTKAAGRRRTSRAALAVDVLAAAPLLSATTLAGALGMSVKSATVMLDRFVAEDIVMEVTHRSARRLYGLAGMTPVRDATVGPRRPLPGRGRGRPSHASFDEPTPEIVVPPAPIARLERPPIDYAALEAAMAHCDEVIRGARQRLHVPAHTA